MHSYTFKRRIRKVAIIFSSQKIEPEWIHCINEVLLKWDKSANQNVDLSWVVGYVSVREAADWSNFL